MTTFRMAKLVRDELPKLFKVLNQQTTGTTLENTELKAALLYKIAEEAAEIPIKNIKDNSVIEEIADVQQALDDLKFIYDISDTEVEAAMAAKYLEKGGFRKGIYIDTITLPDDDDKWTNYYRGNKKYSEILDRTPSVKSTVRLSELLAELGKIDRATLLPGGRYESDSHHSFSLALIAQNVITEYCPELDAGKVMQYALVHDLLEIITGDHVTLTMTAKELHAKHLLEKNAWRKFTEKFADYPTIIALLAEYEKFNTAEAATVYVLDKTCTIWTHFWDKGANLRSHKIMERSDIDRWYETQVEKMNKRLHAKPPKTITDFFESSYLLMRDELFEK